MPATPVASYLTARVAINCRGGGYTHKYDMLSPSFPAALQDLKMICKALSMVLESGSQIANAVISSKGGIADGVEVSHGDIGISVLLIQSGALGTETITPGTTNDPGKGIRWELDTGEGFTVKRLLRSMRGLWIANNQLVQAVSAPSNAGAAIAVGTSPVTYLSYLSIGTAPYNAADCLSNYFSLVRDKTAFYRKNPSGPPAYLQYGFLAASGSPGNPDWQVLGTGAKKVGKGWSKSSGRNKAFA